MPGQGLDFRSRAKGLSFMEDDTAQREAKRLLNDLCDSQANPTGLTTLAIRSCEQLEPGLRRPPQHRTAGQGRSQGQENRAWDLPESLQACLKRDQGTP